MNIKDYLHLYLGCNVESNHVRFRRLVGFIYRDGESWPMLQDFGESYNHIGKPYSVPYNEVKPILRPLSDMTEEEKKEFQDLCGLEKEDLDCLMQYTDRFFEGQGKTFGTAHLTNIIQWATGVKYLLSKHFDLFGLIESGLAIDKTKL